MELYTDTKINKKFLLWGAFALFFALIVIGLFLFFSDTPLSSYVSSFIEITKKGEGVVTGGAPDEIYLSLARKGDDAVNIYALNVNNGRFSPLFDRYGDKNFGDTSVGYTSSFSQDGKKLAYIAASRERSINGSFVHGGVMNVFVLDTKNGKSQSVSRGVFYPILLQWSPDGKRIAFTGLEAAGLERLRPNNWSIYVTDLEGNTQRLTHGTYPNWSPDGGTLIFMRADGLYLYDLSAEKAERVYPFRNGDMLLYAKMGVSPDGALLAISDPFAVSLFKIFSWEPFQMDAFKVIRGGSAASFWPVFSPDSRFLALQQVDVDSATQKYSNPRLVVYDLENFKSKTIASLADFNFNFAFTSDWRYWGKEIPAKSEEKLIDNDTLKNMLVDGSPWTVTWEISGEGFTKNGTQKMNFFFGNDGTEFSGELSDSSAGVATGFIKDISTRDDGCIRFRSAVNDTAYVYCIAEDATLNGYLSGVSPQGSDFVGDAVAVPSNL